MIILIDYIYNCDISILSYGYVELGDRCFQRSELEDLGLIRA